MSCNNPEISDLLLLLLENSCSPEEEKKISDHLACCTQCRKEYEDLTEIMNTIKSRTGKPGKDREHISPEDLSTYVLFPEEIDEMKKEKVEKHLNICNLCQEEVILIRESPEMAKQEINDKEAVMPALLMEKFRETYPVQKFVQDESIKPVVDDAASTNTFWQQIGCIFKPNTRFAYILTVFMMIFSFSLGLFVSPRIAQKSETPERESKQFLSNGEFVQYPTSGLSNRDLGKMVGYLQNQGISAYKYKNEIWVKDTQVKKALGLMVMYQEQNNIPGNPMVAGNNRQPTQHSPVPGIMITPGVGGFSSPIPVSTDFPIAHRPASGTGATTVSFPGEEELFSSYFTHRNGVSRTPWDVDRPSDAVILHHEALTTAPSLLASDLEERDLTSEKIRKEFSEQVFLVLDKRPDLRNSLVYSTVSLGFQKNQHNVFPIKGVKITVVTASPISNRDRRIITNEIREAIGWNEHWDGDIEFTTP
jgi:hypothetical protein